LGTNIECIRTEILLKKIVEIEMIFPMNIAPYTDFIKCCYDNKKLIFQLAKKDFYVRYLGSYLGVIWAFINPIVQIILFWFIFEVGFRSQPVQNVPYFFWLICGLIPWFFFSDCVLSALTSVLEGNYLVKKMVFPVQILPMVKITSALFLHLFFIGVAFAIYFMLGYPLSWYNLQLIYYLFAITVLVAGISWISASIVVFIRDIGQVIAILLQVCFFVTPIFWNITIMPDSVRGLLQYNPMIYIIEGYRHCFFNYAWFWENPFMTIYFWTVASVLFVIGIIVFKKIQPHFADVL
jgi:ABC-type polysaccharide/polyol phosphate export permease